MTPIMFLPPMLPSVNRMEFRSGRSYDEPQPQQEEEPIEKKLKQVRRLLRSKTKRRMGVRKTRKLSSKEFWAPYPQKWNDKFALFCDLMKGLHINVPFFDAIAQIPSYSKFLKYILSKKRTPCEEVIQVPYQVSAYMDKKLPKKQRDPGSFSLPVKEDRRLGSL